MIMCLRTSYKKKMEKHFFFPSFKSLKKGVGSGVGSGAGSIGTDPGIRTKMSRIPNTVLKTALIWTHRAFFRQWRVRFPHVTIQRSAKPRNKIALRACVLSPRFLLVGAELV
jgi:hypothetical protein